MLKLGLLGKNISHSLSPQIYREILNKEHHYHLLDFSQEIEIPSLEELSKSYDGLNITSPYKEVFWGQVEKNHAPKSLKCFNCLKFKDRIEGINTDYLALKDLIVENNFQIRNFLILGDGNMADVFMAICEELSIDFLQTSRKQHEDFPRIEADEKTVILNTCGRDYVFISDPGKARVFWDLNYHHLDNLESLRKLGLQYLDGMSLLKKQAQYAVHFWDF